jgi:hypothetical protein
MAETVKIRFLIEVPKPEGNGLLSHNVARLLRNVAAFSKRNPLTNDPDTWKVLAGGRFAWTRDDMHYKKAMVRAPELIGNEEALSSGPLMGAGVK